MLTAQITCNSWNDSDLVNDQCFKFVPTPLTQQRAQFKSYQGLYFFQKFCQSLPEKGTLLEVDSNTYPFGFIPANFGVGSEIWLGATRKTVTSPWVWKDETPAKVAGLLKAETNQQASDLCIKLLPFGVAEAVPCSLNLPFVCMGSKIPHGKICSDDFPCRDGYECVDRTCVCPSDRYFDPAIPDCIPRLGYEDVCDITEHCTLTHTCVSNKCVCFKHQFYDVNATKSCINKYHLGYECKEDYECMHSMECISNKCGCPSPMTYVAIKMLCLEVSSHDANLTRNKKLKGVLGGLVVLVFVLMVIMCSAMRGNSCGCRKHSKPTTVVHEKKREKPDDP
ncbi:uncharacterized protein LOC131956146 [Physella acuta]|uniref:uncharacterized protein LOC131956146 n=1 Tax=Physella acuta TaxID=109671 RepID=UPI0027DABA74|nr:uncharacterized protein LOC131956146 [Physella acuta]